MHALETSASSANLRILKWLNAVAKLVRSKIIASILLFALPAIIIGALLEIYCGYTIFTKGVLLSLLVLAIGPVLIDNAYKILVEFFEEHKNIFQEINEWKALRDAEIARFQSLRYMIFGVPWAAGVTAVVFFGMFRSAPIAIKIYVLITFFVLFFICSFGFYGVYVVSTMIRKICASRLVFDPYHLDNFGGLGCLGQLAVKASLHFSVGALIIPLAVEVIQKALPWSNFCVILMVCFVGSFLAIDRKSVV